MSTINIKTCPLRKSLKVLGGKWNMIIIKNLSNGELRLSELKRSIPDISEKVLISKLKDLQAHKMVVRKDYQQVPPKVGYALTDSGRKAFQIVQIIENFGERYL